MIPQVFLLLLPFLFYGDFRSLFLEFSFVARFVDGCFSPDFFEGIMGECLVPICG
jgi:hypothetical protein